MNDIVEELENVVYFIKQHNELTRQLIQKHITQYDIEKFVENEYIKDTDGVYYDYDYDLCKIIDLGILEAAVKMLKEVE